jgi:hypothetical protein
VRKDSLRLEFLRLSNHVVFLEDQVAGSEGVNVLVTKAGTATRSASRSPQQQDQDRKLESLFHNDFLSVI